MHEMHEERRKKEILEHLPRDWDLDWAEILNGRRILVKGKGVGWERSERDWDIWKGAKSGRASDVYLKNVTW